MSQTYGDVDASASPATAVEWQRQMTEWPAIRAYKEWTYELLAHSQLILDVGCGPGVDVAGIGADRTLGLDPSQAMCEAARVRTSMIVRGDAHALPFADRAFNAVRADRVVQHLADPLASLREFTRVLRCAGRLVVADPDQESLVIQVPGAPAGMVDRVKALRRDIGYRNGTLASLLPALLRNLGFGQVTVTAFPLLIEDPADAFGLPGWPAMWKDRAGFTAAELAGWDEAIGAARGNGFVYLVTFLVVSGVRQ